MDSSSVGLLRWHGFAQSLEDFMPLLASIRPKLGNTGITTTQVFSYKLAQACPDSRA